MSGTVLVSTSLVVGIAVVAFVVAFVAWLAGKLLARRLTRAIEQVAGVSSAALVVAAPALLLAVAVYR